MAFVVVASYLPDMSTPDRPVAFRIDRLAPDRAEAAARREAAVARIRALDAVIGDGSLTVMAGPCSIESRDQLMETVDHVAGHGATVIRGGAFKPRTSPYSFQGLGVEGLRYLAEARERTGLPVITEVMEHCSIDRFAVYGEPDAEVRDGLRSVLPDGAPTAPQAGFVRTG